VPGARSYGDLAQPDAARSDVPLHKMQDEITTPKQGSVRLMSRHTIEPKEPERYEIAVGFDAALATYFAQVIDRQIDCQIEREEEERAARIAAGEQEDNDTPERDSIVLWAGTDVREITDRQVLVHLLQPDAELTKAMLATLVADKERERHEPSPLQRRMQEFIRQRDEGNS